MSDTKEIKNVMYTKYGRRCMVTGVKFKLTYHHAEVKRVDGGKETEHNGLIITERFHCYFMHCILERGSKHFYEMFNKMVLDYKNALRDNDQEFIQLYESIIFPLCYDILQQCCDKKGRRRKR